MYKIIQTIGVVNMLILGLHFDARAQTSLDALQEIGRIRTFYYYLDSSSIYRVGEYERQDSVGYTRDTIYSTGSVIQGRYHYRSIVAHPGAHLISREVNNADYNIHVDVIDSIIQVNNPVSLENSFLVIDFYDGEFYASNIDSIRVYDTTSGRKLNVYFNSNSFYTKYELYYDSADYSIKKLEIKIKTGEYLGNPLITSMTWICTYTPDSSSFVAPSFFYSSIFFTRMNKEFILQPPYTDFELINTSGK
jgi:hypothetical protein